MDIQITFSDIRNCFLDIQNNYFGYPKNGINVNSACHTLLRRKPQHRPLSNLNNRPFALRAILPVNKTIQPNPVNYK